ncbi:hypothetical protein BKA82DRAFT_998879, partial [Pisolithus tinctorius]
MLQEKEGKGGLQENLTLAVKKYQTSGVQEKVDRHIEAAFQRHKGDVDALCCTLVDIAKENQMSKKL